MNLRGLAVALLPVASIAACGSDPASSTAGVDGGTSGAGGAAQICVDKINEYRASLGLPPYERWTSQEACADQQAQSDSSSGTFHGAFGNCTELAQNECPGWQGPADAMIPKCLAMMWAEGPGGGHYENMKGARGYTKVACGFHTLPNGSVWSVQDFR